MRIVRGNACVGLLVLACGGTNSHSSGNVGGGVSPGAGGSTGSGIGVNSGGTLNTGSSTSGAAPGVGGVVSTAGGSTFVAAVGGGASTTGGTQSPGGKAAGGGLTNSGGTTVMGGAFIAGGAPSGGNRPTGGTASSAGNPSAGGSVSNGGTPAIGGGSAAGGTAGSSVSGPWPPSATFSNPSMWEDLPDPEVIRVDDIYYYTASNMHYSPGAPILRSWDLVNWEYVGHAVPVYDYSKNYDLNGGQAYIKGTWASSLHYRTSNTTFYWMGCIDFSKTYVYTAAAPEGPWTKKSTIDNCYYDCGMLVDYDDSGDDGIYVAYGGGTTLSVAQLSADGLAQVKTQQVYTTSGFTLEGSHFFKYKNYYYITPTRPANAEFVLRASNVWGPYTIKTLIDGNSGPISGGGTPHQGSFLQTKAGDWYYMSFQDAFPGGRIPVLAPVTWSADGWPSVTLNGNAWAASYPYPNVPRPPRATKPHVGTDTFAGTTLSAEWEWNHNPDNTKWSINNGVTLQTATVTDDLYAARNTLTHRNIGPQSTGTVQLDVSGMKDGDVTGLALLRNASAYVALRKSAGTLSVVMFNGLTMNTSTWATTSTGTQAATSAFSGTTIWLRATMDARVGSGKQGKFSYSTDGTTFNSIGPAYVLTNSWEFYPGYRYGIFNFATSALGGSVVAKSFTIVTP